MPQGLRKRSRRRDLGKVFGRRYERTKVTDPWVLKADGDLTLRGIQITESEGHPFQGSFGSQDVGGPFSTVKVESFGYSGPTISIISKNGLLKYVGTLRHPNAPIGLESGSQFKDYLVPADFEISKGDLNEKGASAVAFCAPANPLSQLTSSLGELFREGLPHLPQVATWRGRTQRILKAPAGEFLNLEFGWLPLKAEIGKSAELVSKFAKLCEQYKRDEGRLVRRQFHFDRESSSTSSVLTSNVAPKIGPAAWNTSGIEFDTASKGTTTVQTTDERKTWFSGAFRYYIRDSIIEKVIHAASGADDFTSKLVGGSLTPELLWELAPWSWAIDYFSNAQEVITNLQRMELEGLFMPYGYVMDENIRTVSYSWGKTSNGKLDLSSPDFQVVYRRKDRVKANPFGFGVSWDDLSPTQLAILAAVGITRLL